MLPPKPEDKLMMQGKRKQESGWKRWRGPSWFNASPFTVKSTRALLLQQTDTTAAGALDGFSHRVPAFTQSAPLDLHDTEIRLEEEMQPTVR